jgi:repressor LexA
MYYFDEQPSRTERIENTENEIYNIIKQHINKNKISPSMEEIKRKSNLGSKSTVLSYMHRLKKKGLIDWQPKKARSISLINQDN